MLSLLLTSSVTSAQTAPNWTLTDIDGNQHTLYDDLDAGYTVMIKFFATWCGYCWSSHNSGQLQAMNELHGPNGDDTWRIYYIEVDSNTGMNELQGISGSTHGDYVSGHNIPVINNTTIVNSNSNVAALYNVSGVPAIYMVCPEDKSMIQTGSQTVADLEYYQTVLCPAWTGGPVGGGNGNNPGTTFQGAVAFQGYQAPGAMTTTLADNGLLPMSQPFSDAPFNYDGTETITTLPNDVVDWVMVELRDANDETNMIDRKAALVDKDGNIIGTDGSFGVQFDSAADGDYYVVIHHAGHVSVMTSSTVSLPNSSPYNFKQSNSAVKGSNQMKLVNGAFTMRAGDYDNNNTINFSDFVRWLQSNNSLNTYASFDGDGSGTINFTDFILWLSNNNHLGYSGL